MSDLAPEVNCIKYADDTTIYHTISKSDRCTTITNSTSHKARIPMTRNPLRAAAVYAVEWCYENSMLLNSAKSSCPIHAPESDHCWTHQNRWQGCKWRHRLSSLGVTFDQHLWFSHHVREIIGKCRPDQPFTQSQSWGKLLWIMYTWVHSISPVLHSTTTCIGSTCLVSSHLHTQHLS